MKVRAACMRAGFPARVGHGLGAGADGVVVGAPVGGAPVVGAPGSGTDDFGCCAVFAESADTRSFAAVSTARSIPAAFTEASYLSMSTIWSGAGTGMGCA